MNRRLFFCLLFASTMAFVSACRHDVDDNGQPGAGCVNSANPDTLNLPGNQLKGWEIYSWPACQDWNFSLLYGSNALKNYDEVTGGQASSRFLIRVWGKNELKKVLRRIPAGEPVSLVGEGWLQQTWGAGTFNNLKLPPPAVINELQQAAVQANLDWQVMN